MPTRCVARVVASLALACAFWVGARSHAAPPPPDAHVTDHAGVLSPATLRSLSARLARYEAQSGRQVIVWIAPGAGDQSIETFAVETFEAWGVGTKELDDGLAVFVLTDARKLRIEVGYDLESTVTDLIASRIIRETMVPRIRANDWDGAIVGGVEALVDTIEGQRDSLAIADGSSERGPPEQPPGPVQILIMVGLGIAFLILMITHPRLALMLLFMIGRAASGGGGGFSGRGGRSGGGGATGGW